jgi:acid phosphatase
VGILAAFATLSGSSLLGTRRAEAAIPSFDHIVVIMLENHSDFEIIGNPDAPYLNALTVLYPSATDFHGVTHPSLPNYMAVTGGDTVFSDDCQIGSGECTTSAASIADGVEAAHRTWKAYMEDMPSPCYTGDNYPESGTEPAYVEKHNPFIHYEGIRNDPDRCNQIAPYNQLAGDLAALPDFVWITPNMCHDMHDGCDPTRSEVKVGDDWLSQEVPPILASPSCVAPQRCLIVITFDEGDSGEQPPGDNHVLTIFLKGGARTPDSAALYDLYSLLRTIEDAWGIPPMTPNDAAAIPMDDMF